MTLPPINLDTRDFEALVDEARALIPRLAPLWTDHNPSDPGITFVELLAWLTDQQIYRVGHVGEPYQRAFAALLGSRPAPPRPARGLIWPEAPILRDDIVVREGTIVEPIEQPQIRCEVERDCLLTPALQTQASAHVSGRQISLQASFATPQASFAFAPRSEQADGNLIELMFDRPLVQPPAAAAPIALGIEIPGRPVAPPQPDAPPPWGPLRFEYRIGNEPYLPVETVFDGTFALSITGVVLILVPAAAATVPSALRLRLDLGYFPVAPEISRISPNVLPVRQAERVPTAPIGRGSGRPDQMIDLSEMRDADRVAPFRIQTEEGGNSIDWQQTDDFCRHGPADRVFRLEPRRRRLLFGNGVNGLTPADDVPILRAEYKRTEGRGGNLVAGLRWRVNELAVEGAYGRNPAPIAGGEDATDAEWLAADARTRARRRHVLLSDDDLRSAAIGLPGYAVARAEVLRNFHPPLPRRVTPGARTLVVMPWRRAADRDQAGTTPPESVSPAPAYPRAIAQALASRRLVGERLAVISARRVRIRVEAALLTTEDHDRPTVIAAASRALNGRLTDIAVSADSSPSRSAAAASAPWPLGRPVTLTEIETVLIRVPGVCAVLECRLAWEDQPFATVDIVLARDEVASGGDHSLSARGETDVRSGR